MGIANSILRGVAEEIARRPGCRPLKVGVRIGELAGIDPEALRFAFDALVLDTDLHELQLDVEYRPSRYRCRTCAREFDVRDFDLQCPACSGMNVERIGGDELEFSFLEVEDHEPCPAGRKGPE